MSRAPLEKKGDEFHQAILEECQQSNGEERRNGRDGLKMDFVLSDDVKEANDGQMENVIRPEPSRVVCVSSGGNIELERCRWRPRAEVQ